MDRLSLYNAALLLCGERRLASLSEAREPRRLLDDVWDNDGVKRCLEAGLWQFAMRSVELTYSPSITPSFGLRRAFDKPSDFVRTAAVCSDEYFKEPLLRYTEEASYWFSDLDTIYLKYVSNDSSYGGDLSLWPGSFGRYAEAYFASEIVHKLTSDESLIVRLKGRDGRGGELRARLDTAKAVDAMAEPTAFPPEGSWSRARSGRVWRDRGNRGRLIG